MRVAETRTSTRNRSTFKVKSNAGTVRSKTAARTARRKATRRATRAKERRAIAVGWSRGLTVQTGGSGSWGHPGGGVPRLLAGRVGVAAGPGDAVGGLGVFPGRDRGRGVGEAGGSIAGGAWC